MTISITEFLQARLYICVYTCIYVHLYKYAYIFIHAYTYIYICIHIYIYLYVCTYINICIQVYVYSYKCIHIHTHIFTRSIQMSRTQSQDSRRHERQRCCITNPLSPYITSRFLCTSLLLLLQVCAFCSSFFCHVQVSFALLWQASFVCTQRAPARMFIRRPFVYIHHLEGSFRKSLQNLLQVSFAPFAGVFCVTLVDLFCVCLTSACTHFQSIKFCLNTSP